MDYFLSLVDSIKNYPVASLTCTMLLDVFLAFLDEWIFCEELSDARVKRFGASEKS